MRAAWYEAQGAAAKVLTVGEMPDPEPGIGEVRVQIAVSGLSPGDIKFRTSFSGSPMAFPRIIPHQDGAGVIDQVGPGVSPARIGERVWVYKAQSGQPFGTAAEYVVLPSDRAVPLPDHVSFQTGASLGIAAITAHRCLFADGDLRGRKVLVHGGAGAVGTAAILLAKWAGAWVATTVGREQQADVARDAGADLVIDRHREDVAARIADATNGKLVDRIVDVDLAANAARNAACLAPSGVTAAYATEDPEAELRLPFLQTMFTSHVFRFVFYYTIPDDAFRLAVREVSACVASGAYSPRIARSFPLERIAEAHEAQESGQAVGKILIDL